MEHQNLFTNKVADSYDADFTEATAHELVSKVQEAIKSADDGEGAIPVFVEDENGRLENITHIWYDPIRKMIRLTIDDVYFTDTEG